MILNVWLQFLIFLTDYCLSKNKCNREEMEEVTLLSTQVPLKNSNTEVNEKIHVSLSKIGIKFRFKRGKTLWNGQKMKI